MVRCVTTPFASTPKPPYTAVIFTNVRTPIDAGYGAMAERMEALAAEQPGYLGFESARDADLGIAVSYWTTPEAAAAWKRVSDHAEAQRRGRDEWYEGYVVRIAAVTREYHSPPG